MSRDFSSLIGLELKGTSFKVKKEKLVEFAESIGAKQPQFLDSASPIAHPAYANAFVLPALMKVTDAKAADGQPVIKNPLKILHGGQVYTYPKDAPPLQDGDKIMTTPKIKNIEVKSNGMLVLDLEATSTIEKSNDESKIGKVVVISGIGVVVMPGGF
jgi:hypothetical protein